MARHRRPGWVPQQHGAWAMLVVPLAVGIVLRVRSGDAPAWLWTLGPTWLLGYFLFNVAVLWVKSPARRRSALVRPLVTYALATAGFGVATLALGGWELLWWTPVFTPLVGAALWLASSKRERSLASGAVTVFAASLMTLVARFGAPQVLWAEWPDTRHDTLVALLVFCYFFGTVFYVKTMIRERGQAAWLAASLGWHAACTALAGGLAVAGWATVGWVVLFALATVRAWLMPRIQRGRRVTPLQVGLLEIAFSVAVVVFALG